MDLYQSYITRLAEIGVNVKDLNERYGDRIRKATFSTTTEMGYSYDGAMLDFVCKRVTPYALQEAKLLRDTDGIDVDDKSIMKVCMLCFVSKSIMLIPNDSEYKIKKGELYKYDDNVSKYGMRQGMKSLLMCMECGVTFNDEEIDAMTSIDRMDDYTSKVHGSVLGYIVRRSYERAIKVNQFKNRKTCNSQFK